MTRAASQLGIEPFVGTAPTELRSNWTRSLAGMADDDRGKLYRVRVMQANRGQKHRVRQSVGEYFVTYDQLSPTLQRLNQRGSRVVNISPPVKKPLISGGEVRPSLTSPPEINEKFTAKTILHST